MLSSIVIFEQKRGYKTQYGSTCSRIQILPKPKRFLETKKVHYVYIALYLFSKALTPFNIVIINCYHVPDDYNHGHPR